MAQRYREHGYGKGNSLLWGCVAAALMCAWCGSAWGQGGAGQPTFRSVTVGFGRHARSRGWALLNVTVTNPGAARDVEVVAFGEALDGVRLPGLTRTRLHLPASSTRLHAVYVQNPECEQFGVELYENGRLTDRDAVAPFYVAPTQMMIVGLSEAGEGFACSQEKLAGRLLPLRFNNTTSFRHLPARRQGYEGVDVVALGGLPAEGISPKQERALVNWVRAGGLLILCPGGAPDHYEGTLIESISPVTILGRRLVKGVPSFEEVYGTMERRGDRVGLSEVAVKEGRVQLQWGVFPLVISRAEGVGRVVFVAFDITSDRARKLARLSDFYRDVMALDTGLPIVETTGAASAASGVLHETMGVRVPRMGVVGAWLAANLVLVVGALLLSRKRREWGFAGLLLGAPLLALGVNLFAGAASGVGGVSLASVSVVRSASGESQGAANAYYAVLSDKEARCDVALPEAGACFPAALTGVAEGSRTVADALRSSVEFSGDDVKGLRGLRVQPRAVVGFQAGFAVDLPGALKAEATFGEGGISVAVTNGSDRPFRHGFVACNRNAVAIGDLDPGESTSVILDSGTARGMMGGFSRVAIKSKSEAERDRLIRALYAPKRASAALNTGVQVFGWIDGEPATVDVSGFDSPPGRKARTLWAVRAREAWSEGRILLPKGTIGMRVGNATRTLFSEGRWGTAYGRTMLDAEFFVPAELRGMKATRITLFFRTGRTAALAAIEMFNHTTGEFDVIAGARKNGRLTPTPLSGSRFRVPDAEQYLCARRGVVRVRLKAEPVAATTMLRTSRSLEIEDFDIEIEGSTSE